MERFPYAREQEVSSYGSMDEEANVWVATSDDIPGLATEVTAT
ncbi:hypothetical protein BQ8482_110917 [Mesorhizobium delmotii]|uniref:DUF1902 domain-containing protein n=1 Tax=Mesorhizobium delmotii TaxID=1631247 RepID=A0A2P9ACX6_9HYPH|nr:hypothetical protein BQ8482_110917 [Mesorhizobium delmotii]